MRGEGRAGARLTVQTLCSIQGGGGGGGGGKSFWPHTELPLTHTPALSHSAQYFSLLVKVI